MGLLSTLLPEQGPYLLATPASFVNDKNEIVHYFRHKGYGDPQTMELDAKALAKQGTDVYFALGSIHEVKKKEVRKQPNIARLKAFWLDLDVEPGNEQKYSSKKEAATALKAFVRGNGLPKPTIVDSGNGLHVYWPMTESVEKDQWRHYANILKAATDHWGLKADPSRTGDCASVLRVPGTFNYKGDPLPVDVAVEGPVTDPQPLMAAIAGCQYNPAKVRSSIDIKGPVLEGQRPSFADTASDVNSEAAGGVEREYLEANPKRTVARCQQLLWQAQNPEAVEEPQWYDMIGCLRHAKHGEQAVHVVSRAFSGYSREETDKKIEQHKEGGFGPTLCETFELHRPGGCQGCPFAGRISTPLALGKEREEAPQPTRVLGDVEEPEEVPLPKPPFPFKRVRNPGTGESSVAYVDLSDEVESEIIIYEHDIYPRAIIYDEREGRYVVELERYLPQDGWETFPVPLGKFYDRRHLATTLGDIGVMPDLGKIETLVQYMIGYIRELQKSVKATTLYAQLGWRDEDKFVLGDRILRGSTGEVEKINPHKNIVNALSWEEPRGDVQEWRKVMAMYEGPGMEAFQFGIGVGFAAPLFKLTNFNGMIVSMVGEKGCGKSSVMHVANSIWGHKSHSWADIEHDTVKAFYNKLGVLKNLPVCYDEITNLNEEELSDLCYAVSKGQGRQRLNQDGSAKENFGAWQTMMLTTSNASLHSRLSLAKADASAEAVRVFEFYVPSNMVPKREADETLDLLNSHYGLAGELFMREVMKDLAAVKQRIKDWTRLMEQKAKVTSGERFWAAGPACVLTAYELTNRLGLSNVDLKALANFSVQCILSMREAVKDDTKTPVNTVADYLNGNLRKMLVLNDEPKDGSIALVGQEPRDELRIRYESWHGMVYIDRSHFRQYCAANSIDVNRLKRDLTNKGIMLRESRVVLGKGTAWKTAQTWCWVIDMNHPDMGNTTSAVNAARARNASEVANEAIAGAQRG